MIPKAKKDVTVSKSVSNEKKKKFHDDDKIIKALAMSGSRSIRICIICRVGHPFFAFFCVL